MPAGGNWIVQDKRRPGTYINVLSATAPQLAATARGVVAVAIPLDWGPENELIEITGADLTDGKSLSRVGFTAFDAEKSLPLRLALSGCNKALVFRSDVGGTKAQADIDTAITVVAKYPGLRGNTIKVNVEADKPVASKSTVTVLVDDVVKETVLISSNDPTILDTFESDYVDFIISGTPVSIVSGTKVLAGGSNGTVGSVNYATFFSLLGTRQFNCLAIQSVDPSVAPLIETAVRDFREGSGRKVQGVVYGDNSFNYEGIVSVKQGFKTEAEVIGTNLFPLWVASQLAGAGSNKSKTAFEVKGAKSIIEPIAENQIVDALREGWFILTTRQDGAICVEQDINSLHEFTTERNYVFSKNRVVRCLDEISNLVSLKFSRNYAGKVDNNGLGRNLFKSELITDLIEMQGKGAIQNFQGATDVIVLPGETIESVVVDIAVQPVDSMEKLYVTIVVQA